MVQDPVVEVPNIVTTIAQLCPIEEVLDFKVTTTEISSVVVTTVNPNDFKI